RLQEASGEIPRGAELLGNLSRLTAPLVLTREETEQRVRVHDADVTGTVQLGAEEIDHSFAEIGIAGVPPNGEGEHCDSSRQRPMVRRSWASSRAGPRRRLRPGADPI